MPIKQIEGKDGSRQYVFHQETVSDVKPIEFWCDLVAALCGTIGIVGPFAMTLWTMKP